MLALSGAHHILHVSRMRVIYLLTPWSRVLLEKLASLQLVKKFPVFYGTRRFLTALTSARHLSLTWASPIQSSYPTPTSWRSLLILSSHLRLILPAIRHEIQGVEGRNKKKLSIPIFLQRKEKHSEICKKKIGNVGGVNSVRIFVFFWGSWNLTSMKCEGWVYSWNPSTRSFFIASIFGPSKNHNWGLVLNFTTLIGN